MEDYILEEMNKVYADGVDFMPISDSYFRKQYEYCKVIDSYTKERWIVTSGHRCIPKTPYVFWKLIDGSKTYL